MQKSPLFKTFAKEPLAYKLLQKSPCLTKEAISDERALIPRGQLLERRGASCSKLTDTYASHPVLLQIKAYTSSKTQVQLCDKDGLPTWFCKDPNLLILILINPRNNPKLTNSIGLHSVCLISLLKRSIIGSFCSNQKTL